MEKTKKVTKAQRYEDIIAMLTANPVKYDTDVSTAVEFIEAEIQRLSRKNQNGEKKPSKAAQENPALRERIKDFLLEQEKGVTATYIFMHAPGFDQYSNQKVTRLCSELVDMGEIVRKKEKGQVLFSIA